MNSYLLLWNVGGFFFHSLHTSISTKHDNGIVTAHSITMLIPLHCPFHYMILDGFLFITMRMAAITSDQVNGVKFCQKQKKQERWPPRQTRAK